MYIHIYMDVTFISGLTIFEMRNGRRRFERGMNASMLKIKHVEGHFECGFGFCRGGRHFCNTNVSLGKQRRINENIYITKIIV